MSETKNYPARYKNENGETVEQDIVSHLNQVADKIKSHLESTEAVFSCKLPHTLELMALLHDMGKCNDVFKEYLQNKFFPLMEEEEEDGDEEHQVQGKKRIHHSTAGAIYIMWMAQALCRNEEKRKDITEEEKEKNKEIILKIAELMSKPFQTGALPLVMEISDWCIMGNGLHSTSVPSESSTKSRYLFSLVPSFTMSFFVYMVVPLTY